VAEISQSLAVCVTRDISLAGVSSVDAPPLDVPLLFAGLILILLAEVFRLGAQMKGDLETARRIQFDLVPGEVFHKQDVSVNARMQPARVVGGDLYDVIDLDDRRLALVVGDVTGKGLPAALLMTSIVGSLRALLSAGLRGSELIVALNRHVCTNSPGGRFVTLFYGELDASSGTLTYVNAGHNPPLLRRASGDVEALPPTAMLLGMTADTPVEARQVQIGPADRLLAFTDGLSEAFDGKEQEYGEERVKESLQRAHPLPPTAALEQLVADVHGFCGSAPPHDDMTLMLVARTALTT
jgi:sigma-B regulation protein RsbU (phosphoserine phosphatase)